MGIGDDWSSDVAGGGPAGSGVESEERERLKGDIALNAVGG
jgi:hypothetical protein